MVVFISARMPPSRCAIADVVVLLGEWLRRRGAAVEAIAWEPPPPGLPPPFPCAWLPEPSAAALAEALAQAAQRAGGPVAVNLQTSQYDLHPRALAGWMARGLATARRRGHLGRLQITFHELHLPDLARRREWYLRPWQIASFRRLLALADACRVTCATYAQRVRRLRPGLAVQLRPVCSNFGEPDDATVHAAPREPGRWVVCGSHGRILESLRDLAPLLPGVAARGGLVRLDVFGGQPTPAITECLQQSGWPTAEYHAYLAVADAGARLLRGHAMWLSYREAAGDASLLGKSGVLAAALAHGVLPVLAQSPVGFAAAGEPPPHLYSPANLPPPAGSDAAAAARAANLAWYRRHAAVEIHVRALAADLGVPL